MVKYCPTVEELDTIQRSLECPVENCGKVMPHSSALNMHLNKTHGIGEKLKPVHELREFHCPVMECMYHKDFSFKSMKNLKQHYLKVHAAKRHKCARCGTGFSVDRYRQRHESRCGVIYKCTTCACPYTTVEAMLTHCKRKGHNPPAECLSQKRPRCSKKKTAPPSIVVLNILPSSAPNPFLLHPPASCTMATDSTNSLKTSYSSNVTSINSVVKSDLSPPVDTTQTNSLSSCSATLSNTHSKSMSSNAAIHPTCVSSNAKTTPSTDIDPVVKCLMSFQSILPKPVVIHHPVTLLTPYFNSPATDSQNFSTLCPCNPPTVAPSAGDKSSLNSHRYKTYTLLPKAVNTQTSSISRSTLVDSTSNFRPNLHKRITSNFSHQSSILSKYPVSHSFTRKAMMPSCTPVFMTSSNKAPSEKDANSAGESSLNLSFDTFTQTNDRCSDISASSTIATQTRSRSPDEVARNDVSTNTRSRKVPESNASDNDWFTFLEADNSREVCSAIDCETQTMVDGCDFDVETSGGATGIYAQTQTSLCDILSVINNETQTWFDGPETITAKDTQTNASFWETLGTNMETQTLFDCSTTAKNTQTNVSLWDNDAADMQTQTSIWDNLFMDIETQTPTWRQDSVLDSLVGGAVEEVRDFSMSDANCLDNSNIETQTDFTLANADIETQTNFLFDNADIVA